MKNKNRKPRRRWNWHQVKLDYFASPIPDVKAYFEEIYDMYNGSIAHNTTGWREEKIAWKNKAVQEALDSLQTKEAKKYEAMSNNLMAGVALHINDKKKLQKLHPKALKTLWEITRTMQGLPTRITREHLHHDTPITIDYSSEAAKRLKKYSNAEN